MLQRPSLERLLSVTQKWENRSFDFDYDSDYQTACVKVIDNLFYTHNHKKPIILFFDSPVACLFAACLINYIKENNLSVSEVSTHDLSRLWYKTPMITNNLFNERQLSTFVKAKVIEGVLSAFQKANWESEVDRRIELSKTIPENCPPVSDERNNFLDAFYFFRYQWNAVKRSVNIDDYENVIEEFQQNYRGDFMTTGMHYETHDDDLLPASFFNLFVLVDLYIQFGLITDKLIKSTVDIFFKGVFDIYWDHDFCLVSKLPLCVSRNQEDGLQNSNAMVIGFADGFKVYTLNNNVTGFRVWDDVENTEIAQDDFLNEANVEIQAVIYAILGDERMIQMLGAKEIDKQTVQHKNGDEEVVSLFKTESNFDFIQNNPFAWVKIFCPSTERKYLIGVEPHHTNALTALASLSPFERENYSFDFRT